MKKGDDLGKFRQLDEIGCGCHRVCSDCRIRTHSKHPLFGYYNPNTPKFFAKISYVGVFGFRNPNMVYLVKKILVRIA